MKSFIVILVLLGGAFAEIETAPVPTLCLVWSGWGQGLAGDDCKNSIASGCVHILDVIPELIDFFTNMDWSKLGKLVDDLYVSVTEMIKQYNVCNYLAIFINFFPHVFKFLGNLLENIKKIQMDLICVTTTIMTGDYYSCGICMGHITKVILSD